MSITRRLFAVSPTPALQASLTSPEAIVAQMRQANSVSINAIVRAHWFDPDLARQWLDHCRSDRFSRATINALPPAEQNARVVELWVAFGKFWRAMNLSPYGWARYRRLCEALWGYPSYAIGQDGWKGKANIPYMNGRWGGAWRQRAHAAVYTPNVASDQKGRYSPAFGGQRSAFYTSAGNPNFGPTDVVFGTREPYAIENAGNRPGQKGVLPSQGFAPTVEVHRVFMQRDGNMIGSYPDGLNRAYAESTPVATANVTPRSMAAAWRDFNFSEPTAQSTPGAWDAWTVGFALPDDSSTIEGGGRHRRTASTDVQWTVPPLVWYHELLTAPYPLSTGSGERVGYYGLPSSQNTPTISVLDYLAGLPSLDALVREMMYDVMQRNTEMADSQGFPLDRLAGADLRDEIDRRQEAATPSLATSIFSSVITAGGGVVSLATGNPAGLAAAGMLSSAAKMIDAADNDYDAVEARRVDVFGRLWPPLDTVAIADNELSVQQILFGVGTPSGESSAVAGPYSFLGSLIGLAVLNSGPLTIVGMPHYGTVEVGKERELVSCRWVDDALTQWRCTIPTGPQWVRVEDAAGNARLARTGTSNIAPATIAWEAMLAEHHYVIAGLPPGSDVFVDGASAMGTWDSDAQTAWHVFMPLGPHAVRLVSPTGEVALVEVVAAGAQSQATWQQLVTRGQLQRQEASVDAASGGGSGWVLPVVVTVGAAAILWATLTTDGRPKRNPSRRR